MELLKYDHKAAQIGLQQAAEVGPQAFEARLIGIERDRQSAQNELDNPVDAYWSGEYQLGVDGRGNTALVTSELGMIPGRAHRENSSAMSDSMVRNVAYTLDQINEGNLPHSSWRAAIEQVRQFRAFQQEAVTLRDGESLFGFVMNGLTTEDGVALMHMTRHGNTISYETRLVGGISEGAATDLLDRFSSEETKRVVLKEGKDSPLYSVVRGSITLDLKNKQQIADVVQDVLDTRHETKSHTVSLGTCRTVAVNEEQIIKNPLVVKPITIEQQKQEYAIKQIRKNPFDDLPVAPTYYNDQQQIGWIHQRRIWDVFVRPWLIFDTPLKKEKSALFEPSEKKIIKINIPVIDQRTHEQKIPKEVIQDITLIEQSFGLHPTIVFQKEPDSIQQEERKQPKEKQITPIQKLVPITTFVTMSDFQPIPRYEEKAITLSLTAIKSKYVEQVIQEPIVESVSVVVQPMLEEKTNVVYKVDQIVIQDLQMVTEIVGKQIAKGDVASTVTKLVWMESNSRTEFVPVEEVEIAQDSTRTLQNLLHFLRKVVRKYCGEDSIRPRRIQKIVSDKWDDEIEEIEEYLTLLKTRRMYNHLFAVAH